MRIVRDAAFEYLHAGITAIPIALDGSKAPLTFPNAKGPFKWESLSKKAPTEDKLETLFAHDCGLAVLGGKTSGGLEIIDFDIASAYAPWSDLVEQLAPGLLARLPVVKTPNGYHVYFRSDFCARNQRLALVADVVPGKKSKCIIETRGEGGYVIAPPSPASVHPSGTPYALLGLSITAAPRLTEQERDILISAARSFTEVPQLTEKEKPESKPRASGAPAKPGEDFDDRASWREVLAPHGWQELRTVGEKTYWRRPGKDAGGISATTGFCGTKLYVFSSNAQPFEPGRAYNKFTAYGRLEHGGDFRAASAALRLKGYGAPMKPQPNKPTPATWDALTRGLDNISGDIAKGFHVTPEMLEAPPPTDDDAPTPPPIKLMTATVVEELISDDAGLIFEKEHFERIAETRTNRPEWIRIQEVLRRFRKKAAFDSALKDYDRNQEAIKRGGGINHGDWRDNLLQKEDRSGNLKMETCLTNLAEILRNDPSWAGVICFNDFTNQIVTRRDPPYKRMSRQWADEDALQVKAWVERNYPIRPSIILVWEAIIMTAKELTFNPLTDWLDSLEDGGGESAIDTWLIDCFGAADTELNRAFGRKWLISAVARAYEPGCKVDTVLVLEGKQGLKKSRALSQLCPDASWFRDGLSDLGSVRQASEIEGKWIVELAELKGIGKDLDQTKAFITRQAESYRPAYGRADVYRPRRCILAGTVNPGNNGYLKDETGNRRWWPVLCTKQAPEITPALRDRLWAEAKALYLAGEKWWFTDDEEHLSNAAIEAQSERAVTEPWQDLVSEYLVGKYDTNVDELLKDAVKLEAAKWKHSDSQQIGRIMSAIGWHRYRKRAGIELVWRYRHPNPPPLFTGGNGHDHASPFS